MTAVECMLGSHFVFVTFVPEIIPRSKNKNFIKNIMQPEMRRTLNQLELDIPKKNYRNEIILAVCRFFFSFSMCLLFLYVYWGRKKSLNFGSAHNIS